jgi:hypothetical protein
VVVIPSRVDLVTLLPSETLKLTLAKLSVVQSRQLADHRYYQRIIIVRYEATGFTCTVG